MQNSSNVKYINPPNHLKMKVGGGGIPEDRIDRAQKMIETFQADFRPEANAFLIQLSNATNAALKNIGTNKKPDNDNMIIPIMQLKANGGMFQYQLLTDVADICLQFMEAIDEYNEEAIDIIKAHENAINIIIKNDLKGDGGQEGYVLVQELHQACNRYFKKYTPKK